MDHVALFKFKWKSNYSVHFGNPIINNFTIIRYQVLICPRNEGLTSHRMMMCMKTKM